MTEQPEQMPPTAQPNPDDLPPHEQPDFDPMDCITYIEGPRPDPWRVRLARFAASVRGRLRRRRTT